MRLARLLIPNALADGGAYHLINRVCDRRFIFGDAEKHKLLELVRRYERFCGLRVLTFCLMSNHFHLLVEVPPRPVDAESMPDEDLVARVQHCQGKQAAFELAEALKYCLKKGDSLGYERLRRKWLSRMWNLAAFVQSVKQRFSVWYNRSNKRRGTLWEERFKSVIAMGPEAVASMAAYIDLNPVRAGIVVDPKDYSWSGYGRAVSGDKMAKAGLRRAFCEMNGAMLLTEAEKKRPLEWYRSWIYMRGVERGVNADGKPLKRGVKPEEAEAVVKAGGKMPAIDVLRQRVRYFTDGLAVGSKELLEEVFQATRDYFGPRRTSGARTMKGEGWGGLKAMRDLREAPEASED